MIIEIQFIKVKIKSTVRKYTEISL